MTIAIHILLFLLQKPHEETLFKDISFFKDSASPSTFFPTLKQRFNLRVNFALSGLSNQFPRYLHQMRFSFLGIIIFCLKSTPDTKQHRFLYSTNETIFF